MVDFRERIRKKQVLQEAAIEKESDIHSDSTVVKRTLERKKVEDTDVGRHLKEQIADLEVLLAAYRSGVIAERL